MICQRLTDSPFTGHAWGNILSVKDANGNPLTYRDGMTMTWQNGRELATLVNGNKTMSYTYGADGLRTTKLLNSTLHTYEYVGGQLLYETRGAKKIHYVYDSTGNVLAAIYKPSTNSAEQTYYYAHNWRGDVIALYDDTGSLYARYDYDAWGKLLSIKDASGNDITYYDSFAIINPFRYRGYFYDTESGLYYLQSRYYDPTTGRFVNGDALVYTTSDNFVGLNLFAYTGNNPVNRIDSKGTFEAVFVLAGLLIITEFTIAITLISIYSYIFTVINDSSFQYELNRAWNIGIENLCSFAEAISKGISNLVEKAKTIIKKSSHKSDYWIAIFLSLSAKEGTFLPVLPISYRAAISYVRSGGSVFASSRQKAYRLAKAVGNGREPKKHSAHENGKEGYFRHYHAVSKNRKKSIGGHVFYL